MNQEPLLLSGVPGSPYTRKMVALLRYRRIPYQLTISSTGMAGMPASKPPLLPTFYLPGPNGETQAVTDSTPLIRRFENEYAQRSVIPADPGLALLDALIEDFADEWLTKAMFHYRWRYAADIHKAERVLACWWQSQPMDDDALNPLAQMIAQRQISRLHFVGSNPQTGPVIEAGYVRVLQALEEHLRHHPFLLGQRPASCDFALYGQLTQLAQFDPTPMALAVQHAPRVCAWVGSMEDLSGLALTENEGWFDMEAIPSSLRALLLEIGRLYAPLLLANDHALRAGMSEFQARVDGQVWQQNTFPYQGKCLSWLRRDHQALNAHARSQVGSVLAGTGCESLFQHTPVA